MNLLRKIGQLMICKKENIGEIFNRAYTITTNENDKVLVADINKFKSDNKKDIGAISVKRFNEIITSLGLSRLEQGMLLENKSEFGNMSRRKLMIYNYII